MRSDKHQSTKPVRSKAFRRFPEFMALPVLLVFLELALRIATGMPLVEQGLVYTLMFSLSLGILLSALTGLFSGGFRRFLTWLILIVCVIYIGGQFFYFTIFGTFATLYSMLNGGEAFQFVDTILAAFGRGWYFFPLLLAPVAALIYYFRKTPAGRRRPARQTVALVVIAVALHALTAALVWTDNGEGLNSRDLYFGNGDAAYSVERFGALTGLRLDVKKTIFPASGEDGTPVAYRGPGSRHSISDSFFADQVYDLDFDKLIANAPNSTVKALHEYFQSVVPTNKNAYTGKFEGYNLILLTAEGFSPYVVDKNLTPTLYKLVHEGYYFTNYYNPVWNVSTSDGEYVLCTGQIPKGGVWSFKESSKNYMPFTMGNQYRFQGLTPQAYHNHTYSYYDRDLSHPNAGYLYRGLGNGLDVRPVWPESDLEMMQKTVDNYINEPLFHTYYMTVSGHLNYTFTGNMQASKHKDEVAGLPYSEHCRAYIACNIEFDRAMEYLIQRLEDAGIADRTLIVFSNDHYPYGLTEAEQLELAGLDSFDPKYEMYRSNLIIWSGDMKGDSGKQIDKFCYQADIIPTISNLLGISYDSRMLSGTDIFSDSEGLVIFKDKSWRTDMGYYIAPEGRFIPADGVTVPDGYKTRISQKVRNLFWASSKILETNYFKYIITAEQKRILDHPIPLP